MRARAAFFAPLKTGRPALSTNALPRVWSCLLILAFVVLACRPVHGAGVSFRWAVLAGLSDGMQALDFSGEPVVFSGTALQIYLEHLNNSHLYLYLLDSGDNLTPLYPPEQGYYDYGFPRGPKLIPPGNESFTFVPPPGIETLVLIASVDRLFQLEQLTEQFRRDPDQSGQQRLLLERIEALLAGRQQRSKATEDRETVTIRYKTADGMAERSFVATEVDRVEIYGRKIRIDHR